MSPLPEEKVEALYSTVRRVETESGSHIEPPLDPEWTDLEKLRWQAAVVREDAGVAVKVHLTSQGDYSVQVGRTSSGGCSFWETWVYLNGISAGAQAARLR